MDSEVVLARAGKRVKQTKCRRSHVRHMQKTTNEEAMKWSQSELGGTLLKYARLVIVQFVNYLITLTDPYPEVGGYNYVEKY